MTPANRAAVSLVTVSYFSEKYLGPFLDSVTGASSEPVASVVVNNAPDDADFSALAATLTAVTVVEPGKNLGYGKAMNLGATETVDSEWLLLSNPDLTLSPGAIDELVRVGDSDPRIGAVGPLIRTPSGEIYPSARRLPSLRNGVGHAIFGQVWKTNPWTRSYLADRENPPRQRDAGWLSGACILVRRAAFEQVGGFDDKFFMYFEDVDLCARIGRADWRIVYAPSAELMHVGGASTDRVNRAMIRVHHESAYSYLAARYTGWYLAPVRLALRVGLRLRASITRR
ncbi:glycosyltransferase family 2 protein [Conyzicola sp.]|uniref:glycosyltransferase family 2 protein n=1 Tax=Conyzicola sp. TaxID=1969404 RepID=UPI003988E107